MVFKKTYLMLCIALFLRIIVPMQGQHSATSTVKIFLFVLDECRITQELSPEINEMYKEYRDQFEWQLIFPNFSSKKDKIESFLRKYHINIPYKTDYFKNMCEKYNISVLPTVVVLDETQNIVYHGAINDLFITPGRRRPKVTQHYLKDVLFALKREKDIPFNAVLPVGCFVNYGEMR